MSKLKILEVIVTSATEAIEAERGGADRLELVRDLDTGGLTARIEVARAVTEAVKIPVRAIVRENASMLLNGAGELQTLKEQARELGKLRIDGLVMGWVTKTGAVDVTALEEVLAEAGSVKVTFHRAFEHLQDPFEGLKTLKRFRQIDKLLTGGGEGTWEERRARLRAWRDAAAPEIQLLVGGGISFRDAADLVRESGFPEIHVGRAARTPEENDGAIDAEKIERLKASGSRG